jgi:SanA protein
LQRQVDCEIPLAKIEIYLKMKIKFTSKRFKNIVIWSILITFLLILVSNLMVRYSYSNFIYSSIDSIPQKKVGLLLGTNKYLKAGGINPYYQYRIEATAALIKKGKIKFVIVSGDNSIIEYNEPVQMRDDLIRMGVDSCIIYLDYAGFRTLDSIIRAKIVFGQDDFIVISQPFHNQRAIFIARQKQINAIAFDAQDVEMPRALKVQVREIFARVKLMIDLYLINKQPKFLGEKVIVGL